MNQTNSQSDMGERALQIVEGELAAGATWPEAIREAALVEGLNGVIALGTVYEVAGRLAEAERCYRQLIDLNGVGQWVLEELGNFLWRQGRLEESHICFRRAVDIDANFSVGWRSLALISAELGRKNDALVFARHAAQLIPDDETLCRILEQP